VRGGWPGHGHDRGAATLRTAPPTVTAAELEGLLRQEPRLLLVAFWSPRCEPCRELLPRLARLAEEGRDLCRVVVLDTDREPEAASIYGVRGLPLLVFFRGGQELARLRAGALPASTRRWLETVAEPRGSVVPETRIPAAGAPGAPTP
jgi:thioredoxin-like negative regulator of GroEL